MPDIPPLRQDIAVVVADAHLAAPWSPRRASAGGELLRDVAGLRRLPRREALGDGRRSLALRLTFQAEDRTLTDEEVRPLREAIVEALARRFGAELRS